MFEVPPSERYRSIGPQQLKKLPQFLQLRREQQERIFAVAAVLPFRVNPYVVENLIDWESGEDDPIFRMTFPLGDMLKPTDLDTMLSLMRRGASKSEVEAAALPIRAKMNPHPANQTDENIPIFNNKKLSGIQHKYRETVLFFPKAGQTCHSYCTYCFRWAQFVQTQSIQFAEKDATQLVAYLQSHPEVSDVLITGGDPLIMKTRLLRANIEPLLEVPTVQSIRIGTKSTSWWPQRFVSDADADDLLRLFEKVIASGRHLALMAHYTHPRELATPIAQEAVRRIRSTGANIRTQSPILRGVNDNAEAWADLWRRQVQLGAIPYYMFIARDTGPKDWFQIPLAKALHVFREAYKEVSGLARTVRGPSMSATPGKIAIQDILEVNGECVFVCNMVQGRDPDWASRTFFAEYDPHATWLSDLRPAFGASRFFFETEARDDVAVLPFMSTHSRLNGLTQLN